MKILHLALITSSSPQKALRNALRSAGKFSEIDWMKICGNIPKLHRKIISRCKKFKPDLLFMQIQRPGIVDPEIVQKIRSHCGTIVNWSGDVRQPTPKWYFDVGSKIDLSLFTNDYDVEQLRKRGIRADYLQIGFDDSVFSPNTRITKCPDIVFFGNNYGDMFPLSELRRKVVYRLKKEYGNSFGIYGNGWNGFEKRDHNNDPNEEASIYRSCAIGINLSHYDLSRYSSDRIFRLMGSGAFCLSHRYENIEFDFKIGVHLDVWNSLENLVSKIDFYLENETIRRKIAENGCKLVRKECSWKKRIQKLLEMIS